MTDIQRFIELYASLGITFEQEDREGETVLMLEAKCQPRVGGYTGFSTSIHFNKEGTFLHQDFWE